MFKNPLSILPDTVPRIALRDAPRACCELISALAFALSELATPLSRSLSVTKTTTLSIGLTIGIGAYGIAFAADDLETTSCPYEAVWFVGLHNLAGHADEAKLRSIPNISKTEFVTRDGRTLRGYRLTSPTGKAKGYLLVAQGNAQLADQMIGQFPPFAALGLDVYLFDYRGYGTSEGISRIRAIFDDYKSISDHLNRQGYQRRDLYGFSFGGVVLMNAIGLGASYDAAIIDSPLATISSFGCPKKYDPIANVPADSSKIWIISGTRDTVVSVQYVRPLGEAVQSRGGNYSETNFNHPFPNGPEWSARVEMFTSYLK